MLCPMSGQPLRLKDLISVKFTRFDPAATFSSLEGHKVMNSFFVAGITMYEVFMLLSNPSSKVSASMIVTN